MCKEEWNWIFRKIIISHLKNSASETSQLELFKEESFSSNFIFNFIESIDRIAR